MWGKTIGAGADWFASAMGNVVNRKSPRVLVNDRSVSAANGVDEVSSATPVKPSANPLMSCPINADLCPFAASLTVAGPFPAVALPLVWKAATVTSAVAPGLASAKPVSWLLDLSIYIRARVVAAAEGTPDSVTRIPPGLNEKMPAPTGVLPEIGTTLTQPTRAAGGEP